MSKMKPDLAECTISRHPRAFVNKAGQAILVKTLDDRWYEPLVDMYLAYEPKRSFSGLPPETEEACRKWVAGMASDGVNLIAVAFDHGVVGHSAIFPLDERRCELFIVMSPEFQNIGIGTELVRCMVQLSRELGFGMMWLCVEATNLRCRHVLQKCGFNCLTSSPTGEIDMGLELEAGRDPMGVKVSEIMTRHVTAIFRDWPCRVALDMFLENHVGALPVINDQCQVIGILSQTDLIEPANIDRRVGEVFTRQVVTVHGDCSLAEAVRLFHIKRVRCIPVLDQSGRLVGIVTRKDVLAHYSHQAESPTG